MHGIVIQYISMLHQSISHCSVAIMSPLGALSLLAGYFEGQKKLFLVMAALLYHTSQAHFPARLYPSPGRIPHDLVQDHSVLFCTEAFSCVCPATSKSSTKKVRK